MSDPAIRVENLGKKYVLRHQQAGRRYKTLRDALTSAPKRLFSAFSSASSDTTRSGTEEFWALKDVSFDIQPGESVGIIGRNGAGKSTLLKILSRITEPTQGRIEIAGRVASLLEVGTGFHPELTGRENIFLNGAILGMSRVEIRRKFDEIVAFAEVEKFLDTPVKRYSSGMYVRLAFAVAAHMEPEILIVDEVLAVGDMEFQKKCLGKMERVTERDGRTLLFVSHSMDFISKLCSKAILLSGGKVQAMGDVESVTREYLNQSAAGSGHFVAESTARSLQRVSIDDDALREERLVINIGYRFSGKVIRPTFGIVIYTEGGSPIFGSNTMIHPFESKIDISQGGEATVSFPHVPIWSGRYHISIWISDGWSPIDHQEHALTFEFVSPSAPLNAPPPKQIGAIHLPATWTLDQKKV